MENKDKNITLNMNKWTFNEDVSKVFDEMLSRSILDYNTMRNLVNNIAYTHINNTNFNNSRVLDIGCSNCGAISKLIKQLPNTTFIGIDESEPMITEAKKKFRYDDNIILINKDILTLNQFPYNNLSVVLSILTIQFTPVEHRQRIINMIYDSLDKNGLFIFVEKILGNNHVTNKLYEKLYYQFKEDNNYSVEEIRDKKLKLERILVPLTDNSNKELLKEAGFKKIDVFWKNLNFIGYIAYKT